MPRRSSSAKAKAKTLEGRLNELHPRARNRDVVTYCNRRYKKWFLPGEVGADGKVTRWLSGWEMIGDYKHFCR